MLTKPNALKVAHIQDGLTGETPESLRPAIRAAIRMVRHDPWNL